jgi:sulfite reductase (NADPH) flavoprotein alpha-component
MTPPPVPFLPESAPFTAEQRAYLNGFLAGLFSRMSGPTTPTAAPPQVPPAVALSPLTVCFGTQTGTAEGLARRIAREASKRGFAPTLRDLSTLTPAQLAGERTLLVVTSTYGDGEPPDSAKPLWQALSAAESPRLEGVRFSVCGIGDSNYPRFCGFARDLDARLAGLGAVRVVERVDCDTDPEEPFLRWVAASLSALQPAPSSVTATPSSPPPGPAEAETAPRYSRSNPFPARLVTNRRLNAAGSAKDVRHLEIALAGSGLSYEAGDALAVVPRNDPARVDELLRLLGVPAETAVTVTGVGELPLAEALHTRLEITRIPKPLLEHVARTTGDSTLLAVTSPDANGALSRFLHGREIVDLLLAHPGARPDPQAFVGFLRRLPPRLYSISSSPKAHPGQVHLTVGTVRYESLGRARAGVCSTFLADRVGPETPVPVFVHVNRAFRPPAPDRPLVMVGPGTGIAPFRAFLQERRAVGATGKNWLFFGDQRSSTDFLYREELEGFQNDGTLHRLDLAWSRDGAEKVYVQDRMRSHGAELFRWLEDGGAFCVCGDAARMAKDVDAALHAIIAEAGGRTPDEAAEYVRKLQSEKRYLRDVY